MAIRFFAISGPSRTASRKPAGCPIRKAFGRRLMACLTFTSNVKCEGRGQRACLSLRWSIAISAGLGGVLPILALVISNRVARRSAQPFVQFDDAIGKMQNVGFEKVALPDMQRSPIAEIATSADRLITTARARARQSMCSAFS